MGYYHRIAEAARAVANAVSASTESTIMSAVGEALSKTEEHILCRYAVDAIYGKEAEVRRTMFARIIEVLESRARPRNKSLHSPAPHYGFSSVTAVAADPAGELGC
jgi:hypothetical protein